VHPEPRKLLPVVKSFIDMLVWLQLCNPQGVALFTFIRLPPRVVRPFAGAPVYNMSLTHAERLRVAGCGFKGKLVRFLSLGVGHHFEPQRNWGTCCKMMQSNVRRVAAGLAAAVRDKVATEAEELCASGQCAAAVSPLQWAIDFGHLPSRALMAWLLIDGREGIARNWSVSFQLAEDGARLGCHHCQGMMAYCYWGGFGCTKDESQSLQLARESSLLGSRYGQLALGEHLSPTNAVACFRLAAAQGLDGGQYQLGYMYFNGSGVDKDRNETLRLYNVAAAQGLPIALDEVQQYDWGHDLWDFKHQMPLGVAASRVVRNHFKGW